jgi:2-polyprenyl-6-methoxyphenol hydroxylase-like FAD-dependent oxidoreductase
VGDAGYHRDPLTGQGITDAIVGSEMLAEALDAGFAGRSAMDDALARYELRRNEASMPFYELNSQLATLEPPPVELQMLIAALATNPEATSRFFGVLCTTVPVPQFMSPENIGAILQGLPQPATS